MRQLILGLLVFGLTTQFMISQEIELSEVYLDVNYKYLEAIESEDLATSVKMLEKEVAYFNLQESDFYNEDRDRFKVSFFIPEGKIVAIYDKDGRILQTYERFKNIKLPRSVMASLLEHYPKWNVTEDLYRVDYNGKKGIAKKQYRIKLANDVKKLTVKFDENGEYL